MESPCTIVCYIIQDVTGRVKLDHYRLPSAKFESCWVHLEFCLVSGDNPLTFPFKGLFCYGLCSTVLQGLFERTCCLHLFEISGLSVMDFV